MSKEYNVGDKFVVEIVGKVNSGSTYNFSDGHYHGSDFIDNNLKPYTDEEAYRDGMLKYWDVLSKIMRLDEESRNEFLDRFYNDRDILRLISWHTPQEIINDFEKWEKEKEEKSFKPGDIVKTAGTNETFIVLAVGNDTLYGYSVDGKYKYFPVQNLTGLYINDQLKKTGGHFDVGVLCRYYDEFIKK